MCGGPFAGRLLSYDMADIRVTREIATSPEVVWGLVSDLPRMGERSPENQGGTWIRGATGPTVGAKFKGKNSNHGKSWSSIAKVTDAEPGSTFAFDVTAAGLVPISRWEYEISPTESGCTVTERWTDRRPGWFKPLAAKLTGVGDRAEFTKGSIEQTLASIAAEAESAG